MFIADEDTTKMASDSSVSVARVSRRLGDLEPCVKTLMTAGLDLEP